MRDRPVRLIEKVLSSIEKVMSVTEKVLSVTEKVLFVTGKVLSVTDQTLSMAETGGLEGEKPASGTCRCRPLGQSGKRLRDKKASPVERVPCPMEGVASGPDRYRGQGKRPFAPEAPFLLRSFAPHFFATAKPFTISSTAPTAGFFARMMPAESMR